MEQPSTSNMVSQDVKLIVAPMVDQSELAWRLLCRKHGANLCFTPMFHALNFVKDPIYRRENLQTCSIDRPLIVQFCANDPETLVQACLLAAPLCDGVDLNLGCPQSIAKRGHYGSFLQDEWPLIAQLVQAVHERVTVPISCKIRVFEDLDKSVKYARMLEEAGCQFLTVHGRTREQKGRNTGLADWDKIKAIKQAVKIPVYANGNVQYYGDVLRCLEYTGVDGVMSAEGNLHNPYIFEDRPYPAPCWEPALEYLDLVETYPCSMSFVRGHLFKLLHFSLLKFLDLRENLATSNNVEDCRQVTLQLQDRCRDMHEKYLAEKMFNHSSDDKNIDYPFWLCKPYVRPAVEENGKDECLMDSKVFIAEQDSVNENLSLERHHVLAIKRKHKAEVEKLSEELGVSKNKAKKLRRFPNKVSSAVQEAKQISPNKCPCGNPLSIYCVNNLCKLCCRVKFGSEITECKVHRSQSGRAGQNIEVKA